MNVLIISFSSNKVNENSFVPNKIGLTFSCVEECIKTFSHRDITAININKIFKE